MSEKYNGEFKHQAVANMNILKLSLLLSLLNVAYADTCETYMNECKKPDDCCSKRCVKFGTPTETYTLCDGCERAGNNCTYWKDCCPPQNCTNGKCVGGEECVEEMGLCWQPGTCCDPLVCDLSMFRCVTPQT